MSFWDRDSWGGLRAGHCKDGIVEGFGSEHCCVSTTFGGDDAIGVYVGGYCLECWGVHRYILKPRSGTRT